MVINLIKTVIHYKPVPSDGELRDLREVEVDGFGDEVEKKAGSDSPKEPNSKSASLVTRIYDIKVLPTYPSTSTESSRTVVVAIVPGLRGVRVPWPLI